ncbi:ribosome-binding factor A [Synergistales bacterium]|nr:ribosome-binding factor A [Synergistales bacterium]GHV49728.1 ribosome-binding factor A [Synergistales bacterium]
MTTYRIERLNREFLRLIAELLAKEVKNDAAREAVLTSVDCSRDLSHAKIYYTLIDDAAKERTASALEIVKGRIRGRLGKEMHIRQIPELHFIYDESEKRARTMDALIDKVIGKRP